MSDPLGHALLGLGFGGYFFYQGLRLWRDKRDIQNKPVSKIRSLAMGDVEVYGQVKAEKLLKAPYSGCDCVYFNYKVEIPDRNGWREVQKGEDSTIFYIDDGTDQLLVNPEGAAFYGPKTFSETIREPHDMYLAAALFSDVRVRISPLGGLPIPPGPHRITEYAICTGQWVFAEGAISKIRHSVNGVEREENILGRRATGRFVLSTDSEERLLSRFGWQVPVQVFGGAALLLSCLWYLVARFELERYIK